MALFSDLVMLQPQILLDFMGMLFDGPTQNITIYKMYTQTLSSHTVNLISFVVLHVVTNFA